MIFEEKIEEIKQSPEHVRIFWTWVMTGISTAVVVIIWLLSFGLSLKHDRNQEESQGVFSGAESALDVPERKEGQEMTKKPEDNMEEKDFLKDSDEDTVQAEDFD
jgi:hypothetical protein